MDEDFILIVDNLLWLPAIELEGQLVRVYGQLRGEGRLTEVCELMTAIAHHRREEVHFHSSGIIPVHPVLTEVYLHRLSGSRFGKLLHRTEGFLIGLGDAIFVADTHHQVEHRLLAHLREVCMMLPQMVMNLAA